MAEATYRNYLTYDAFKPPTRRPMQVYDMDKRPEARLGSPKPSRKAPSRNWGVAVFLGFIVVALLFMKIGRLSIKTGDAKTINSLKTQVNELSIENDSLAVTLAKAQDIGQVELVARGDMNMRDASMDQIRYVSIPSLPQEEPVIEAAYVMEAGGFWGPLNSWFNN